jgi:hypothetical protein
MKVIGRAHKREDVPSYRTSKTLIQSSLDAKNKGGFVLILEFDNILAIVLVVEYRVGVRVISYTI